MTSTPEMASRSNSCSMARRSSRNRSNTSFAAALAEVVNLVGPVIGELHIDSEIFSLERRDDLLQRVAIFAAHAHGITLDRSLHFELCVFNEFHDLARFFD